jgi:CcmD family protein
MTLRDAVPYVAAAYIAVWIVVLIYVALIGRKLVRIERSIAELERDVGDPTPDER